METNKEVCLIYYHYDFDDSITNVGIVTSLEEAETFVNEKNKIEREQDDQRFLKTYKYEPFTLNKLENF